MKNKKNDKLMGVLLASAISGAIIGLLMTPKKELSKREKIAKEGDKYFKEISDTIDDIRRFLDHKSASTKADIEATKDDIDELSKDAKGKGRDLLKRAKKLLSYEG